MWFYYHKRLTETENSGIVLRLDDQKFPILFSKINDVPYIWRSITIGGLREIDDPICQIKITECNGTIKISYIWEMDKKYGYTIRETERFHYRKDWVLKMFNRWKAVTKKNIK